MTPPTPEQITALEQWARKQRCGAVDCQKPACQRFAEILDLIASWREGQEQLAYWKTCSGCGEQMDAPGHCTNAAALTDARQVLREVDKRVIQCSMCYAMIGGYRPEPHTPDCAIAAVLAHEEK